MDLCQVQWLEGDQFELRPRFSHLKEILAAEMRPNADLMDVRVS